jgi:hypothetical protein
VATYATSTQSTIVSYMYWGAAKYRYRISPCTANVNEMEKNMLACLDAVPLLHLRR